MTLPVSLPDTENADSRSDVAVLDTIGRTPQFWDRNVIFFANLLGLFFGNEEQTQMLSDEVGEVDSYGGRLLPILDLVYPGKGENLLILERAPDDDLVEYFSETAGLSLPELEILAHPDYLKLGEELSGNADSEIDFIYRIREHSAEFVDGYVTDSILSAVARRSGKQTISSHEGSRFGNNKWMLHSFIEEQGLPFPATEIVESAEGISKGLGSLRLRGFSAAVVRAPLGASGIGMIKIPDLADCDELARSVPRHFFTEGPCLVQGWLSPGEFGVTEVRSPSVQLFLRESEVAMYDITEQILSKASIHEGNESPPRYLEENNGLREELLRQAGIAGGWLYRQGYRGTASVDFLVAWTEGDAFTVYICEINARVTGATYPSVLARHFLPEGSWLLRNLRFDEPVTGKGVLDLLGASGDLFVPGQSEFGVFPVNFNFGKDGLVHKGQFLCLASSPRQSKLLLRMAELDLPCRIDRD